MIHLSGNFEAYSAEHLPRNPVTAVALSQMLE